jgi:hypothetical protein
MCLGGERGAGGNADGIQHRGVSSGGNLLEYWYDTNENCLELGIMVPLEDGMAEAIQHLPVTTPTKTLEQMTCPTGSSNGVIKHKCKKKRKDGLQRRLSAGSVSAIYPSSWISSSGQGFSLGLAASVRCLWSWRIVS